MKPPWPRRATTSRSASLARSSKSVAAGPSTITFSTVTPAWPSSASASSWSTTALGGPGHLVGLGHRRQLGPSRWGSAIIGSDHAWAATSVAPHRSASLTAQARARRPPSDSVHAYDDPVHGDPPRRWLVRWPR